MRRLYLSSNDRKISGVCGGIGEAGACPDRSRRDIDPTVVRLAAVFLCVATGIVPLVVTYIVARFIVPKRPAG
jgi:phage shock protein C